MESEKLQSLTDAMLPFLPANEKFWLALAGSALRKSAKNLHDVDFMMVVEDDIAFLSKWQEKMEQAGLLHQIHEIPELFLHTWKVEMQSLRCSFHLTSLQTLDAYLQRIENPEAYFLRLDALHLNAPTVYRTWLSETSFLLGDEALFRRYQAQADPERIPKTARDEIRTRLRKDVAYARELPEDAICGRQVMQMQIFAKAISLCYVENQTFYATLKYLDEDLKQFTQARALADFAKRMARGMTSFNDLLSMEEIGKEGTP